MEKEYKSLSYFKLYKNDFRFETQLLSNEQKGAYIELLIYMSDNGGYIKNDHKIIKKITKISQKKFSDIAKNLVKKRGFLVHPELRLRIKKQRAVSVIRAKIGSEGGQANAKAKGVAKGKQLLKHKEKEKEKEVKEDKAKALSEKKPKEGSLEKLCLEDIQTWLDGKRALGRYHDIDEKEHLEYFKSWCIASDKRYKNYSAAFRNSFEWSTAIKKGDYHAETFRPANKPGKAQEARRAIQEAMFG